MSRLVSSLLALFTIGHAETGLLRRNSEQPLESRKSGKRNLNGRSTPDNSAQPQNTLCPVGTLVRAEFTQNRIRDAVVSEYYVDDDVYHVAWKQDNLFCRDLNSGGMREDRYRKYCLFKPHQMYHAVTGERCGSVPTGRGFEPKVAEEEQEWGIFIGLAVVCGIICLLYGLCKIGQFMSDDRHADENKPEKKENNWFGGAGDSFKNLKWGVGDSFKWNAGESFKWDKTITNFFKRGRTSSPSTKQSSLWEMAQQQQQEQRSLVKPVNQSQSGFPTGASGPARALGDREKQYAIRDSDGYEKKSSPTDSTGSQFSLDSGMGPSTSVTSVGGPVGLTSKDSTPRRPSGGHLSSGQVPPGQVPKPYKPYNAQPSLNNSAPRNGAIRAPINQSGSTSARGFGSNGAAGSTYNSAGASSGPNYANSSYGAPNFGGRRNSMPPSVARNSVRGPARVMAKPDGFTPYGSQHRAGSVDGNVPYQNSARNQLRQASMGSKLATVGQFDSRTYGGGSLNSGVNASLRSQGARRGGGARIGVDSVR